nr:hypothetical protein [Tanacetum cinerariifolium]
GDVFDLIGDVDPTDEDEDTGMGDSTSVSASLDGEIFSGGKKCRESNIGDSDNTGDGGKIVVGIEPGAFTERYIGSHYPKTYWESLPKDILGVITRRHTESHYPKTYWESLPKDILGVITPKTYWESLSEDIRHTGSHYLKIYFHASASTRFERVLDVVKSFRMNPNENGRIGAV